MRVPILDLMCAFAWLAAAAVGCSSNGQNGDMAGDPATGSEPDSGGGAGGDGGGGGGEGGGGGGPDSSTSPTPDGAARDSGGGSDSGAGKDAAADASTCINGVPSPGSGHHNAGTDCAGCHDSLGASRRWTVAGTLFASVNGGAAVSGATIEVIDAANKTLMLPTYSNGNFYTTTPVTLPLRVRASKCPDDASMMANASAGSCNRGGCHTGQMRIHLP